MESKRTATTYFIPPGKFLLMENALGNPDLIQSSVSSDCRVTIVDTANFPLDELEQWPTFRLVSADTKLKLGDGAYYIYIVVPTPDNEDSSTAFIAYNTVRVNRDGYEIVLSEDEEGNSVETNGELLGKVGFKYYQCGTVSAQGANSSAVTVPAGKGRLIEMDLGVTPAPSTLPGGLNDFDKVFQLDKVDPSNPSSWLLTILTTIKTMTARLIRVTGSLIFGQGENEKAVTDVAVRADSDKEEKVSDTILASTAWVNEVTDDRFLRKDQDDKTPYSLEVGKNLTVDKDVIVGDSIRSKVFASGFTGGQGWSIRNEKWTNAANEEETRSVAEFDDLIIRNSMRVYEFIVSQLLGENDNRIFTGMMEVDHYDAETGRIYLKTDNGKLYNPFRVDDVIIVQQYGEPTADNGFYVTKEYEFIVTDAKVGDISKGEDRLDWITFNNFVTTIEDGDVSLITERDTLVRIDNLSNPDRKGIIQMMAAGKDTPYMDIIYGRKTDPDNSLKGRLGNLGGVYNELFGDGRWLRGFGAYLTNLYAVGEFVIAHEGLNVSDIIKIAKGEFRTNFRQTTYDLSEEDNFFTNAALTNNCEHWILGSEDGTGYFMVDGLPQFFNFDVYATEDSYAGLVEWKGRDMLRLNKSMVRQLNSLIRKPSTHKKYGDAVMNEDGSFTDTYEEIPNTLYLTVRLYVASASKVELGFIGEDGAFIGNDFHFVREIESNEDAYDIKLTGTWDGQGDFCITSTGDVYVDLLSLTDKPLENFKIETGTKFEQDGKRLALLGQKVNQATGTVTDLALVVDAQNEQISSLVTKTNAIDDTISSSGWINEADSVRIFSEQLDAHGVATKAEIKVLVQDEVSKVEISADKINLTGAVTFDALSDDVKNTLDSKVDSSTIISGGYIKTDLIDANALTVNRVVTTGDSFGVNITIEDGEITMKTASSVNLLRLYSNGTSSSLELIDDTNNIIRLIPSNTSIEFSNGKKVLFNSTNGIELRGGMGISYFTLGRISTNGFDSTSDFSILPNGGTWNLPSAKSNIGRMLWIYPKREATLKDNEAVIYKSDGETGNTLTISGMSFLISDGSNWYQGSCK